MNTLKYRNVEITWLKHAGFRLKGSKIVYIDPYEVPEGHEKADLILITHDHFDHLDMKSIRNLAKKETVVVHPKACTIKGFESVGLVENQNTNIKGVEIIALPAYNTDKPFHKSGVLGYIVNLDGVKVYHAGDTDRIPEMKKISVDIALLPAGGTYTMDLNEAIKATQDIKAEIYIPMHYGAIPNTKANPAEFKAKVSKALILEPLLR
ncbi:MAG: MBL fold metallo-hydrolase [Archaeoglobaceae archaeon]|nr:MBL fold metallo-hydrolase [Archaeoglobaceae archaeon]MDW8117879.1 MBL fold metallo-hydrolase [Archaeoglobaceae archaeon]